MRSRTTKLTKQLFQSFKEYPWVKYITFPDVPVLYFEAGCISYEKNAVYKKLGLHTPEVLSLLDRSYEAWRVEETRVRVTESKVIKRIINENYRYVAKHKKRVSQILKRPLPAARPELIQIMKELDAVSKGLYAWFTFFTDEAFVTKDSRLLKKLPEARLKISSFILKGLFPAFEEVLKKIATTFAIKQDALNRSTTSEILSFLKGAISNAQIEKNSKRPYLIAIHEGKSVILLGKDALQLRTYLEKQNPQRNSLLSRKLAALENNEFSGIPAFAGKAKGRVIKIVEEDFGNYRGIFKKYGSILKNKSGYVLVGTKTRPEIMPYIRRASAIITDIGGITSHAAIVSRELKKPCLIGTDIATAVLNSGDFVEVDANKGIVRIVKRHS